MDLEFRVDADGIYTFIYKSGTDINCGVIMHSLVLGESTLVMSWPMPEAEGRLHTVTVSHLTSEGAKDLARAMAVLEYRVF